MAESSAGKKKWTFITGILLLSIGMMAANYGTTIQVAREIAKMDSLAGAYLLQSIGSGFYTTAAYVLAMLSYVSNLPFTITGLLLVVKHCPNQKVPDAEKGFDYLGVVLSVVSMGCLIFWLNLSGKNDSVDKCAIGNHAFTCGHRSCVANLP